jgi:hypothetical protein
MSVTDMVTAIASEQTAFLTSLGITVSATDSYNVVITRPNDFYLSITAGGGISVYVPDGSGTEIVTAPTTSYYLNLIFTENSLLITKNTGGTAPVIDMAAFACITKNADNTVSIICPDGNDHIRLVERYDYASSANVPYIDFSAGSSGVDQFSLAAIPRTESGKQFDNAFVATATNATVYSGIGSIGSDYFGFAKMSGYTFACK